jgi:hypothetical protein
MPAKLTEELGLVASIPPAVASATTYNSDVIDMSKFHRALFVLTVGAYGAAEATINVQLYANTANSTSGGTAITGKTFTAATFSGSAAGTNKEGLIEVSAAEVQEALDGARYVYAVVTVATNTVAFSLAVLAGVARYEPAFDYDLASVAEIIS